MLFYSTFNCPGRTSDREDKLSPLDRTPLQIRPSGYPPSSSNPNPTSMSSQTWPVDSRQRPNLTLERVRPGSHFEVVSNAEPRSETAKSRRWCEMNQPTETSLCGFRRAKDRSRILAEIPLENFWLHVQTATFCSGSINWQDWVIRSPHDLCWTS
jgi:hypothetical protein